MKYWNVGLVESGYGPEGLNLIDNDMDRVLSISVFKDGNIQFLEECDNYYSVEMSKKAAIEALQEAIDWIKEKI